MPSLLHGVLPVVHLLRLRGPSRFGILGDSRGYARFLHCSSGFSGLDTSNKRHLFPLAQWCMALTRSGAHFRSVLPKRKLPHRKVILVCLGSPLGSPLGSVLDSLLPSLGVAPLLVQVVPQQLLRIFTAH